MSAADTAANPPPRRRGRHGLIKGDFTADTRLLLLIGLAIPIGICCAFVAEILERLIGLFTNIFFYQHFVIPQDLVSPTNNHLGWLVIFVPAVGGLIIGLMARYGSEQIRGHGIPEALEAILLGGSRVAPRVLVLKPLASAVSLGSGGPFGAEGPIIMSGGAFGSVFAQIFRLSPAERKTLLVSGAAAGLSAVFGTPVAAVLLAVELLLFEWKPRSLIPVALASVLAVLLRPVLMGADGPVPVVPIMPQHPFTTSLGVLGSSIFIGLSAGVLSLLLTEAVHLSEEAFPRLPIHWMWWPMLGGLVVGFGGYLEPRALGIGYDQIFSMLRGNFVVHVLIGLMVVKCVIWAVALGSGTAGGVFAPLMMMGAILGALESTFLPGGDPRLWTLVGMAAVLAGSMRIPLTGVVFALELTYDTGALVPLLLGAIVAHGFTVLLMKRSILTDKIARMGYHISQEYSVDPLELLTVKQAMTTDVICVHGSLPVQQLLTQYFLGPASKRHKGYPVIDEQGRLLGVVTKADLLDEWVSSRLLATDAAADGERSSPIITYDLVGRAPVTAWPEETCRTAAERMAQFEVGRLVVVDPDDATRVVGIVARADLLKSRARLANEEIRRERFFGARLKRGGKAAGQKTA